MNADDPSKRRSSTNKHQELPFGHSSATSRADLFIPCPDASAKGRRELNAKIGLNGFKEVARIRRERKPLGDGEGYIGAECS
jgi:hypothetical protein